MVAGFAVAHRYGKTSNDFMWVLLTNMYPHVNIDYMKGSFDYQLWNSTHVPLKGIDSGKQRGHCGEMWLMRSSSQFSLNNMKILVISLSLFALTHEQNSTAATKVNEVASQGIEEVQITEEAAEEELVSQECNGEAEGNKMNRKVKPWSSWSECSTTCGGGIKTRSREVARDNRDGGAPCLREEESRICNVGECEGAFFLVFSF